MEQEYLLEMKGIDKRFLGVHALKGVNLNLKRGEVVALVGENGAGKSTLMKVLTGIHQPDGGTITYEGRPYSVRNIREAQELGIGMIHQELNMMNHLTVAQNIYIGRESMVAKAWINDGAMIKKRVSCSSTSVSISILPSSLVLLPSENSRWLKLQKRFRITQSC